MTTPNENVQISGNEVWNSGGDSEFRQSTPEVYESEEASSGNEEVVKTESFTQDTKTTPEVTPNNSLDFNKLGQVIAEAVRPPANQPDQVTPEKIAELKKKLNWHTTDGKAFTDMFGVEGTPEQIQNFNNTLQGIYRQTISVAEQLIAKHIRDLRSEMQPYAARLQKQRHDEMSTELYKAYPELNDYSEFVNDTIRVMSSEGYKAANEQELFKEIRTRVGNMLSRVNINLTGSGERSSSTERHRMSTSMRGGGHNPGPAKPQAKVVSGAELFLR